MKEQLVGYLTIQVHDPDGRRRFYRRYRSRSFVKNFLQMMSGFWNSGLAVSGLDWKVQDTGSTFRAHTSAADNQGNTTTQKARIGLGSGSTNPAVGDHDIETALVGAEIGDCDSVADNSSGDDVEYEFRRTITNNEGVSWTVREVVLSSEIGYPSFGGDVVFMRDELGAPVTVNDGQAITVDYALKTSI